MKIKILCTLLAISSVYGALPAAQNNQFLEQASNAFTHVADKAMPATVFIKVQLAQPESTASPFLDMQGDEFFRRFFGGAPFSPQMQPQQPQPQIAGGSGFLVSSDGYIVTNHHVIKEASQITVILNDDREYIATIKGVDTRTDLALLKIEEKELPYLTFGDSDLLKVGEWVIATGNPCGLEATLTVGVVSAKGRQGMGLSSYENFIQTDTAINRGNSGGPLLNLKGEVVGINTAIFSYTGGYMGIGFAIPSHLAENTIEQLKKQGTVKRAYLGVFLQPVDKELASALHLEKQEGVLVSEVSKDSPAAKGGMEDGDIILQYNGKQVKNVAKFRNDIAMMMPGATLSLRVLRNNKTITLKPTLEVQNDGEAISTEMLQKLGIELENLTSDIANKLGYNTSTEGVVISKVKPGSPAAAAGIRPSFLITGVALSLNEQKKVKNIEEFENVVKEIGDRKHVILVVRHQNYQKYYTMKIN